MAGLLIAGVRKADNARRKGNPGERTVIATSERVDEGNSHAWVDGRLTGRPGKVVETYFAAHPEVRER